MFFSGENSSPGTGLIFNGASIICTFILPGDMISWSCSALIVVEADTSSLVLFFSVSTVLFPLFFGGSSSTVTRLISWNGLEGFGCGFKVLAEGFKASDPGASVCWVRYDGLGLVGIDVGKELVGVDDEEDVDCGGFWVLGLIVKSE